MAKKSFLSKLAVVIFALTIPFAAYAKNIGNARGGGSSIEWDLDINYESVRLTLIDQDGNAIAKDFAKGKTPTFRLSDLGGIVADGQLSYELRATPFIAPGLRKQLEDARKNNDDAAVRKIQKDNGLSEPLVLSGVITIVNNQIVAPGLTSEPGANDEVVASAKASPRVANDGYTMPTKGQVTTFDQVIPDKLIVQESTCTGFDCVSGESFGVDTLRLKENNLRIHFDDTSTSAGFPANDWRIIANDQASGGANYLAIEDSTAARNPVVIKAGAPANNIYVDSSGNIGFQTASPGLDLHLNTNDTPGLRLDQNNTGGFTAQTWDIGGNEANFFIRDLTGGSKLSFRIRPGAPTSSIDIAADGKVGIGTASPDSKVEIEDAGDARLHLDAGGDALNDLDRGATGNAARIRYQTAGVDDFEVGLKANVAGYHITNGNVLELMTVLTSGNVGVNTTTPSSKLHVNGGDIRVSGGSFIDDGTTLNVPDYVFEDSYKLMPITELKAFIAENKHLPNVPNVADVKANGVNLSQFQMRLLEKVEELTLYTLAQHEQNTELQKRIAALEEQLAKQQ
jgi:hypothetical protein